MSTLDLRVQETDIAIDRGERFRLTAAVKTIAGVVIDLTGHTVRLLIEDRAGAEIHEDTNTVHDDPTAGITRFWVEPFSGTG